MIIEYENTLRRIISLILGSEDNTNFKISVDRLEKWKEKREVERKKHKGVLIEPHLIYFSDFFDLKTIVHMNWELFKEVLNDKKRFEVNFDQIEMLRNTLAHGRSLFSFQESLIKGITGDLKSSLVKYHNKNMDADDYFIRILKISDNIGNQWNIGKGNISGMITHSTIRVNDSIEIIVDAYDPKGREIKYEFRCPHFHEKNVNGKFDITITKEMIGKIFSFHIVVFTENPDYLNKDQKTVHYTVIP